VIAWPRKLLVVDAVVTAGTRPGFRFPLWREGGPVKETPMGLTYGCAVAEYLPTSQKDVLHTAGQFVTLER
jgi:hypothetical protein